MQASGVCVQAGTDPASIRIQSIRLSTSRLLGEVGDQISNRDLFYSACREEYDICIIIPSTEPSDSFSRPSMFYLPLPHLQYWKLGTGGGGYFVVEPAASALLVIHEITG